MLRLLHLVVRGDLISEHNETGSELTQVNAAACLNGHCGC